jgi:biopolymer transport protein ExbD
MASAGGGTESGEPEFQIAPMIDVLLVLLIFFMSITTAEILKVDASITLPISPNAKQHDAKMTKLEVAINVRWNPKTNKAAVLVEDKEYVNPADLVPYLQERLKANPKLRAVVRGDKDLPAIEIQRVMNLVGEGGIADISFAASNK